MHHRKPSVAVDMHQLLLAQPVEQVVAVGRRTARGCRSGLTLRWSASLRCAIASSDRSWLPSTTVLWTRSECTRRRVSSDWPPRLTRSPQNHRRSLAGSKRIFSSRRCSGVVATLQVADGPVSVRHQCSVRGTDSVNGGDRRVEVGAVVGQHLVAAAHRAQAVSSTAPEVYSKSSPGRSQGCSPTTPSPRTSCDLAVVVGDQPVPADQARRHLAAVVDVDGVGEHEAACFGRRIVRRGSGVATSTSMACVAGFMRAILRKCRRRRWTAPTGQLARR